MCTVLLSQGVNPFAVNKYIQLIHQLIGLMFCRGLFKIEFEFCTFNYHGPGSSVGIATDWGLDGLGSNPGGDEIFPPVQTGPGAHPVSCTWRTGSFPGVKCGRGVLLTTHPLLVLRSWKSRAIPLPTLWATPGL